MISAHPAKFAKAQPAQRVRPNASGANRAVATHSANARVPRAPALVGRLRRTAVGVSGGDSGKGADDWSHGEADDLKKVASELAEDELPADLISLAQAEARVNAARAALYEFEREVGRQSEIDQARAAAERGALADLQAAEVELAVAEAEMQRADTDRATARGKDNIVALLFGGDDDAKPQRASSSAASASAPIDQDAERIESAKAATISAVAGSVAALPLTIVQADSLVAAGGIFVSCALFGVVYRYAVRSDFENSQLKLGATAAFGLVRGLGQAESYLRADTQAKALAALQAMQQGASPLVDDDLLLGHSLTALASAALCVGESVVVFLWTAAILEGAMVRGIVKPFGAAARGQKR